MENKIELKELLGLTEENVKEDILGIQSFMFLDKEVRFFKYLPSFEKYDLLMTTLAESKEKNYFNSFKLDMFFHLNLILSYCLDIEYEEDDFKNPYELYDKFKRSGFLDMFIHEFDDDEYKELFNHLQILVETITTSENTVSGILAQIFDDTPDIIDKIKDSLKEINPETITQIKDFLEEKAKMN